MSKKLTKEEFVNKSNLVHHNQYDYSLVNYINGTTAVNIICPIHGQFLQAPNNHIHSRNICPDCANENKKQKYHQKFIKNCNTVHGEYLYPDVYQGWDINIRIICSKHGEFFQTPNNHVHRKTKCPKCSCVNISNMAIEWIQYLIEQYDINIQYIYNGGEFQIPGTKYKADGYCAENNTIYEFHGNYWHGNPKLYSPTDINKINGEYMGVLYEITKQREEQIRLLGYNLVVIWEHEWNNIKRTLNG